jgi:hypothetical protein
MTSQKARQTLLAIWAVGTSIPFGLVFLQTLAGKYGQKPEDAWSWLLPSVLPTIGVMTSVIFTGGTPRKVGRFTISLTILLSLFYLALVWLTLLLEPLSPWTSTELFKFSHLWLAPVQALTAAGIAAVFSTSSGTAKH